MSQEIVSRLIEVIGTLAECDVDINGVIVVNRDAVVEILRGVIQDEWMRTGVLAVVE
tara:strand:+ start:3669 stop:3839 length:171 start_codon:yes stop_codon:yes gene_type:complete